MAKVLDQESRGLVSRREVACMRYGWILAVLLLTTVAGAAPFSQDRKVVLQGTHNTRELGGIPLGAKARFRPGMVYRSGALCYITPGDIETVQKLKMQTVLDFRNQREIAREGLDRESLRKSVPNCVALPMDNSQGLGQTAYYYLIRENDAALRQTFQILARPQSYPVLYHCSAGKDRTGIVTALLLELLGASRADIMDDYLQSQRNSPRLIVNADWLQEVFKVVDAAGGIEPFILHLGVSPQEISSIRTLLRQPG